MLRIPFASMRATKGFDELSLSNDNGDQIQILSYDNVHIPGKPVIGIIVDGENSSLFTADATGFSPAHGSIRHTNPTVLRMARDIYTELNWEIQTSIGDIFSSENDSEPRFIMEIKSIYATLTCDGENSCFSFRLCKDFLRSMVDCWELSKLRTFDFEIDCEKGVDIDWEYNNCDDDMEDAANLVKISFLTECIRFRKLVIQETPYYHLPFVLNARNADWRKFRVGNMDSDAEFSEWVKLIYAHITKVCKKGKWRKHDYRLISRYI